MVPKIHRAGASFRGVTAYCLGDQEVPPPDWQASEEEWAEQHQARREHMESKPSFAAGEISKRVDWTETRNLDTDEPRLAARRMAATASYSEELKRAAGLRAGGRKLEKPVCHYTLSWRKGERPEQAEMRRAVEGSLKQLKLEEHQALVVAHNDSKCAHVHVIVNRVSCVDGRAAKLGKSRIELSRWAEQWEKDRERIQCRRRVRHNRERNKRMRIVDRKSRKRDTRDHRLPQWKNLKRKRWRPGRDTQAANTVARNRVAEHRAAQDVRQVYSKTRELMDADQNREWRELYKRQDEERKALASKPTSKPASGTREDFSRAAAADASHGREERMVGEAVGEAINQIRSDKPGMTRQEFARTLAMDVTASREERMVGELAGQAVNRIATNRPERPPRETKPGVASKQELRIVHRRERTELAELHKSQARACQRELQRLYGQKFEQRSQEPMESRADEKAIADEVRKQGFEPYMPRIREHERPGPDLGR